MDNKIQEANNQRDDKERYIHQLKEEKEAISTAFQKVER